MTHPFAARCGIYCGECEYREKTNCPGCVQARGSPFWGACRVAECCLANGLDNCGLCDEFPCDKLKEFAYDEEQGDNGERIRNLEAWKRAGFESWLESRADHPAG
jgi:hypothetical protein